jgi:hypothetical protein
MTTIDKLHPQHAFASTCILVGFEKNTRNVSFGSCNTLKVGRISPTHREISIMTNDVKTALKKIATIVLMQPSPLHVYSICNTSQE